MTNPSETSSRSSPPLVIVSTTGTGGDIQPFITLARGLHERGHRVVMLVPRFHEEAPRAAGLAHETFGTAEQFRATLDDPALWDERKGWGVVWKGLTPYLDALHGMVGRLSRHERCVILTHPILVPMAALARADRPDLHIVATYLAPSNFCSSHDLLTAGSQGIAPWVPLWAKRTLWTLIHKGWIDPMTLPGLNLARAAQGLPPVPHFFDHMLAAPNASVGLFPDWFASVQADWPKPFIAGRFLEAPASAAETAPLPAELERFLAEGDPPIVFTPGTGHRHAAGYFRTCLASVQRLGRRALFITPHAAQVPPSLPATVLWRPHVPFSALLPRCAAVVHHGGIGTTADAFRAGVPQLVVPFAYDQFDNGLRARRLGVAAYLPAKRLSARRMTRQLESLLTSPAVARACRAVAEDMHKDSGLAALIDQVESGLGL